jgi:hypothetical protein
MAAKDRCCHKSMILAEHNGGSAFSLAKLGAVFRIAAVIQMLIRQVRIWLSLSLSLVSLFCSLSAQPYPSNARRYREAASGQLLRSTSERLRSGGPYLPPQSDGRLVSAFS